MNRSVSVIIPVYNRFERLTYSVESVLAQTEPVFEVILVDDGSTDQTSELLPRYIAENSRWRDHVVYLHQENEGPGAARNRGIAHAKGEWLAFNDNDDLWLPQKLEWQFRALEWYRGQCEACFTDAWFMNNTRMKLTLFELAAKSHKEPIGMIDRPLEYMLETKGRVRVHPVWLQGLLTRTELARRVQIDPQLRYGDDDDFAFRLGCETKFCFVSMPMVLIDRTPPAERHNGASGNWDNADFRLSMAQYRYEKRLRMGDRLPPAIREKVRTDLAAVHSGWANWFLQTGEYHKACEAINQASKLRLTPSIAIKWALTRFAPRLAKMAVLLKSQRRARRNLGIA